MPALAIRQNATRAGCQRHPNPHPASHISSHLHIFDHQYRQMEVLNLNVVLEPVEGPMIHHVIVVPNEKAETIMNAKGPTRILCSIKGSAEFTCALNPRHGRYVIMASKQLIKQHKLETGVPFGISIRTDPHNGLELPEELAEVLAQDDYGYQVFEKLNDGHKRGFIYYIRQARSVDSRIKRSLEIIEKIKVRYS